MEAKTRRIRQAEEPEIESGLRAQYSSSWAVVIGINAYQHLPPLTYAVNDAVAMHDLLVETFGFPTQNVFLLKDKEATKEAIEALFIDKLPEETGPDDRVFVFFAGHGARRPIAGGEKVGYLAQTLLDTFPVDELAQVEEASLAGIKEIVHRQASKRRPRVLMVTADAQFARNEQAVSSNEYLEQLKALFIEKYEVEPEHIVIIEMEEATADRIVQSLAELLQQAANEVVFFYFIGGMTLVERSDHGGAKSPALVGLQLGQESYYIDLFQLAQIAEESSADLLTLFDTLWVEPLKGGNASERRRVFSPVTGAPTNLHKRFPAVGTFSLYATALDPGWLTQWFGMQLEATKVPPSYRMLADALEADRPMVRDLKSRTDAGDGLQVVARGTMTKVDLPFFQSLRLQHQTKALFAAIERNFLARTTALLEALHQRSETPEADDFLNLGIAYAGNGDTAASSAILEHAISLNPDDLHLRYHLGRILYESGQLPGRAIAELTHVVEKDTENARAYYYLGQSIRTLIFQESLQKAEEMLRRYLEKGAPLGQVAAIQAFLDEREAVSRSAAPAGEDRL